MKCINHYTPPTPAELARLKDDLGYTSNQMAQLAGLAQGGQWRKYTGTLTPRPIGQHMHFYLAALLTLSPDQIEAIFSCMRKHGAELEVGTIEASRI